jgi:hypothetical protein
MGTTKNPNPNRTTTFVLSTDVWKAVKRQAIEEGTTMGALIRRLLSDYVSRKAKA